MKNIFLSITKMTALGLSMVGLVLISNIVEAVPSLGPTGNYYEFVQVTPSIFWDDARVAAGSKSYLGLPGRLATITSAEEKAFILSLYLNVNDTAFIGLTDATAVSSLDGFNPTLLGAAEGTFVWITGEPLVFTSWGPTQPDNSFPPSGEDSVEMNGNGNWNDLRAGPTIGNFDYQDYGNPRRPAYIVEYPVPEPSLMVLLGISVMSLVGLKRWWKE